jgi:hypothetical protein
VPSIWRTADRQQLGGESTTLTYLLDTEETRQESLMESDGQQAKRFVVKGKTSSSRLIH